MSIEVRPYSSELEDSVLELSHKVWVLFKHNKNYEHQKMRCVFNEEGKLIAVGYLRRGIADDHDVMEIVMQVNEYASEQISEIRKTLYPAIIYICQAIRNPAKTKLVAWDEFDGDKTFYLEQGFSPFQSFYFAKRSLDEFIPEVKIRS